jgi:hypothetical protein
MLAQNDAIIQDADVARFYFEGMADPDALSASERRRFDMLLLNQLSVSAQ